MPLSKTLRLSEFLPYRLSILSNTVSRQIAELYDKEFGLSVQQWRVMAVVGETPEITATQIGARTAMDKVAISRAVAGLIETGYLAREASQTDARRSLLSLTPLGQKIYLEIVPLALEAEADLMSGLSEDELNQLTELLGKLALKTSPDRKLW